MNVELSRVATELYRNVSPVREIMNFADPVRLREYGLEPEALISFGGGWVNHRSPAGLQRVYSEIINDDVLFHFTGGYSPTNGEREAKEGIVAMEEALFDMQGLSPDQIVIGQSSSQLTHLIFQVLLNPDDRICLLDPSYCNYPLQIHTATGSRIIRFPVVDKENFTYIADQPQTLHAFEQFISREKPKVVLLVSPDNPSGQVLSDEFVSCARETVKAYGGVVVVDFAYKTIVFDNVPAYFASPPDPNFISVHSNSKWGRGLGRRLGWVEAPSYIIDAFESLQNTTILSPDRLHQLAIANYFSQAAADGSLKHYVDETSALYAQTAARMIEAIDEYLGLPRFSPQGGLYTCVQVGDNSAKVVDEVLRHTGVLLVPGWGFGSTVSKAVRLSYGPLVYDHDKIVEGLRRVGAYLRSR